ncbi:MAG: type II 3-dehydroquinate dehydratase [Erysipelotrichales bacterium]|nr:type II 3-dehydroquinate dehydratase [Erysipelotrichales bacterium]
MKVMIINGPNLNMIGIREPGIYGTKTYTDLKELLESEGKKRGTEVSVRQSNHEGDLVDWIQEAYFEKYDGIIINPGAYTHTSIAILDAVKAIAPVPVIEVHLSDTNTREEFRKISYIRSACIATIQGHGFDGYVEALDRLMNL